MEIRCSFYQSTSPDVHLSRTTVTSRPERPSATSRVNEKLIQAVDLYPAVLIRSGRRRAKFGDIISRGLLEW